MVYMKNQNSTSWLKISADIHVDCVVGYSENLTGEMYLQWFQENADHGLKQILEVNVNEIFLGRAIGPNGLASR